MHIAFIPYGARSEVERMLRDMESQKMQMRMTKSGEKDMSVWINGQVRLLPFGVMEYVFPREYKDVIIHTLSDNTKPNRYGVPQFLNLMFRKALNLKPLPKEYSKETKMLWITENVSIMPLGIREDSDMEEPKDMGFKGWMHESI